MLFQFIFRQLFGYWDAFLKSHLEYFVELADSLGGIALVPDSDEEVADSEAELSNEEVISIEDSDEDE